MSVPASKFPIGMLDRSCVALQDILYADDDVRLYVGSRVFRTEAALIPMKGHTWPSLYVCLGTASVDAGPSNCSTIEWSIMVTLCWSTGVEGPLTPIQPSVASFFLKVYQLLMENPTLAVSRYSNEAQANSMRDPDPQEYFELQEVDGKAVLKRAIVANYVRLNVPSDTLEPV